MAKRDVDRFSYGLFEGKTSDRRKPDTSKFTEASRRATHRGVCQSLGASEKQTRAAWERLERKRGNR
jgi:hypothetical protein